MKPNLEDAIGQLGCKTEPSERLKARLEDLIASPSAYHRPTRVWDWVRVGAIGAVILGGSVAVLRLNVTPPPVPIQAVASARAQQILDEAYEQLRKDQKESPFFLLDEEVYKRLPKPDATGRRMRRLTGTEEVQARHQAVAYHKAALAKIHQALKEDFVPPRREIYTVNDYSSNNPLDRYYALGILLCASGQSKADIGDWEGVINEALSAIELGTKVEQGAQWRGWQGAGAVKYQGLKLLARLLLKLSVAQAASAAIRLEKLEAKHAPLSEIFRATRWAAYRTFQTKSWDQCMFDFVISYGPRSTLALKATPKAWIIAEHLRYLEALERGAKEPYLPGAGAMKAPPDAFNQYMAPHFEKVFQDYHFSRAATALVIARLHRRAVAKAPLPEDPYAPGKPLRERSDGLLYSIGPDGVDNGGAPFVYRTRTGDFSQLP